MFKNIGKLIHTVALALAIVFFAAFVGFGIACLLAALAEGVDETLKTAGIQGAVICFVLAIVFPLFCTLVYGFGSLVIAAEEQAKDTKEMKEQLRVALADGMLSDEIARKNGQVLSKALSQIQLQAPAAPTAAPVQRFVEEPVAASEPVEEVEETVEPAQVEQAPVDAPAEAAESAPAAPVEAPAATRPVARPAARPIKIARSGATPLRPIHNDEETF